MIQYFVPYSGKKPAAVLVNGHRLVILSHDQEVFEGALEELGADRLRKVKSGESEAEQQTTLAKIAASAEAGVVIAPREIQVHEVIKNLEFQLPWIQ